MKPLSWRLELNILDSVGERAREAAAMIDQRQPDGRLRQRGVDHLAPAPTEDLEAAERALCDVIQAVRLVLASRAIRGGAS